jgi:hypothetical protein
MSLRAYYALSSHEKLTGPENRVLIKASIYILRSLHGPATAGKHALEEASS